MMALLVAAKLGSALFLMAPPLVMMDPLIQTASKPGCCIH